MPLRIFLKHSNKELSDKIFRITGVRPRRMAVYNEAFRHKSVSEKVVIESEEGKNIRKNVFSAAELNNERLEFLGDAILDAVVAELLFMRFPREQEGFLTEMRTRIVNRDQMAFLAERIGLSQLIVIKPELKRNYGAMKTIASNALESLIGAIYIDRGFLVAREFIVERLVEQYLNLEKLMNTTISYKAVFLKWCQKQKKTMDWDFTLDESDKKSLFVSTLTIDGISFTEKNHSRKRAEELCCEKACRHFEIS